MGNSCWPCLLEALIYARGLQKRPKAGLPLWSQSMLLISRPYCSATPVHISTVAIVLMPKLNEAQLDIHTSSNHRVCQNAQPATLPV